MFEILFAVVVAVMIMKAFVAIYNAESWAKNYRYKAENFNLKRAKPYTSRRF